MAAHSRTDRIGLVLIVMVGLCWALAGCGGGAKQETNQDAVNRFKPQYAELRTKLQQLAGKIPQRASERKVTGSLTPQPVYSTQTDKPSNTDILMHPHLLDPDAKLDDKTQLDLLLANHLLAALQWTGDHSPMSASALKTKATDSVIHNLEQGLQTRYLAVVKMAAYTPVVAVDKNTFRGGQATLDGFLVDLTNQSVVCSFTVSAQAQKQLSYTYKENEDATEALAKLARSSLWDAARQEFVKALNEKCGGDFVLGK